MEEVLIQNKKIKIFKAQLLQKGKTFELMRN